MAQRLVLFLAGLQSASADYLLSTFYPSSTECGGIPEFYNANNIGCDPSTDGSSSEITCLSNESAAVALYSYNDQCLGDPVIVPVDFGLGCDSNSPTSSISVSCKSGAFTSPVPAIVTEFYSAPACPPVGSAYFASAYPLGVCIPQPSNSSIQSISFSCDALNGIMSIWYSAYDCDGIADASIVFATRGCQASSTEASFTECTGISTYSAAQIKSLDEAGFAALPLVDTIKERTDLIQRKVSHAIAEGLKNRRNE